MATTWVMLLLYVGGALSFSFLCSLLEATLLSVRSTELATRREEGDRGAAILLDLKEHRLDDALGAILTLNTVAHTIGAALAGAQAAVVFGDVYVGVFSAALTVAVLVFTEIIPKTLGTSKASALAGFAGHTTLLLTRLLSPILWVTRALTALIAKPEQHIVSRSELAMLVGMARRQGTLAHAQSRVFENVLRLDDVQVEDIMTPRTVAAMIPDSLTLGTFLAYPGASDFSRLPLFRENRDQVHGYLVQRDVLHALATGAPPTHPITKYARPAWFLPEMTRLHEALRQFLAHREHLAVVTDEFGGVTGVVTFEDVLETILGAEILDETDHHVDMREVAKRLRDERMSRKQAG